MERTITFLKDPGSSGSSSFQVIARGEYQEELEGREGGDMDLEGGGTISVSISPHLLNGNQHPLWCP